MNYDCVIFDMDGTLTEEYLDFGRIRAEIGVPDGVGILEAMTAFDTERRAVTERILLDHEMAAARVAPPADGAREVVLAIQQAGLATAVLTRNTRPAMEEVLRRLDLRFDLTFSREDGPIKPSPESIHEACEILGVTPARTACVGDYAYDIQAANAAGCTSILLRRNRDGLAYAEAADHVIDSLRELLPIVGV